MLNSEGCNNCSPIYYYYFHHYTKKGWTPLHLAARNNNDECLHLLLSHRAKINIEDKVSSYELMNIL